MSRGHAFLTVPMVVASSVILLNPISCFHYQPCPFGVEEIPPDDVTPPRTSIIVWAEAPEKIIFGAPIGKKFVKYEVRSDDARSLTISVYKNYAFTVYGRTIDHGGVGCIAMDLTRTTGLIPEGEIVAPGVPVTEHSSYAPKCSNNEECTPIILEYFPLHVDWEGEPSSNVYHAWSTDRSGNSSSAPEMIVRHGLDLPR